MPKTEQEYELELAKMRGELMSKQKELDAQISQVAHGSDDLAKLKKDLEGYQKAERTRLESVIHGVDAKYDCSKDSIEILQAIEMGIKLKAILPPPTLVPHSTSDPKKDDKKVTDMEKQFNA